MTPLCHEQVLQRGLLAAASGDLWGTLLLEKFVEQTQALIELCNFKKVTISSHLKGTTGAPLLTC